MSRRNRVSQGKKPLTHGWTVVPSKTYPDRVYFYNTKTKCSTWSNPCEGTNDKESSRSLSESSSTSSSSGSFTMSAKHKFTMPMPSQPKRKKNKKKKRNKNINPHIEDFDEHDQYFANSSSSAFNLPTNITSPPASPSSTTSLSSKTSISDSDKHSESNILLDNNKKELWVHFVSSPAKSSGKKSLALSDFLEPSTSQLLGLDKPNNSEQSRSSEIPPKKKKQKKKKKKDNVEQNNIDKIKKTVVFKPRDKTPAQTRLLNLRRENAEKLKKLAAARPEFAITTDNNNKRVSDLGGSVRNSFGSKLQMALPEPDDFIEEMDWEPSSEESDVRNINVFRQQADKQTEISNEIFFSTNPSSTLPCKTHMWFLVLDTNIFVSCLDFIKELRDTQVPDLGYPVIYVPWRVLQELDHLKDAKTNAIEKNIPRNVRRAITYLNENFKQRHPRIFGQSFEDFVKMVDFETSAAPDDEILQTCIKFQKEHGDKKLMLLTNDKNLESKAIVSNVEVYSKDSFQKKFLSFGMEAVRVSALDKPTDGEGRADDCLCEGKTILKDFLSSVVETEMKIAFEGDWVRLVIRKPPWTLKDVLECLMKHWRSVFFINFSKETLAEAESLYTRLFKRGAVSAGEVVGIITSVQRLISSVEKSQKEKRPYLDLIPTALSKLANLLKVLSRSNCVQTDIASSSSFPPSDRPTGSFFTSQQPPQSEATWFAVARVKTLFKDIWDSLRGFCCSISDAIHTSGANTEAVIQEMRLKLSQMLNEVEELVTIVERILEVNPQEISDRHPVIGYFSSYLIHVYPNMVADLRNELPNCLAAFFTDFEGRSILLHSLKDFKEFVQDLSKASEYFNAQNIC